MNLNRFFLLLPASKDFSQQYNRHQAPPKRSRNTITECNAGQILAAVSSIELQKPADNATNTGFQTQQKRIKKS